MLYIETLAHKDVDVGLVVGNLLKYPYTKRICDPDPFFGGKGVGVGRTHSRRLQLKIFIELDYHPVNCGKGLLKQRRPPPPSPD